MNPSQPQTLQIAVFLLYINAFFAILGGLFGIAIAAALVAAGYGTANDRKWGYGLALVIAFAPFVLRIVYGGINRVFSTDLITLMFEIALVALLVHPQSREYQRIWFK